MIELIGITASVTILICFLMNDEKHIRIIDSIGALLFVIYGILINSFSVTFLNGILIIIQIYKLYKLNQKGKDYGETNNTDR